MHTFIKEKEITEARCAVTCLQSQHLESGGRRTRRSSLSYRGPQEINRRERWKKVKKGKKEKDRQEGNKEEKEDRNQIHWATSWFLQSRCCVTGSLRREHVRDVPSSSRCSPLRSFIVSDLAPALRCLVFSISDAMYFSSCALDFAEVVTTILFFSSWLFLHFWNHVGLSNSTSSFFFFLKLMGSAERHRRQPLEGLH